ncbi:MAG: hypothetical protein AAFY76_26710, partial [Cyanobacteria bacterium J06649_11]
RIELGGANSGFINLNSSEGWIFNYENVENFGSINLDSQALVDASGIESGFIQLQGKNIVIDGGSKVFIQNLGMTGGGEINATATDSIEILGNSPDKKFASRFLTTNLGTETAAQILISTPHLLVSQQNGILSETFSRGKGGNININAFELLQIDDTSLISPNLNINISTLSFDSGKAGDINISTKQLSMFSRHISSVNYGIGNSGNIYISADNIKVLNGAVIAAATLGIGDGGNVNIDAKSINLRGINNDNFTASSMTASTLASGNAGNLTINTENLIIQDGGRVDSSTFAFGNSGTITINATNFIEVSGTVPGSVNPSLIISSANITDEAFREFL